MTIHETSPNRSTDPGHTTTKQPSRARQQSQAARQVLEGRRLTYRISVLLGQRTSPSQVMMTVMSAALILGLIGFAPHVLWIATIIVMGLGLGYVSANTRLDRSDSVNQRQEDERDTARRG
jgi:hypothetical protein